MVFDQISEGLAPIPGQEIPTRTAHDGDARTVTETISTVETDHNDGSIDVATHDVTLAMPMIHAIEGQFQTADMKRAAQGHAGDAGCPYPHTADDVTRCPVLASYQRRDTEIHEGEIKALDRAKDAAERERVHQQAILADRRQRRDEINRGQFRRNV